MAKKEVLAAIQRQLQPGYVSLAQQRGVTDSRHYFPANEPGVNRLPNNDTTRQTKLMLAEDAAYATILALGLHLPTDPFEALLRMPNTNLFTFRRAAMEMGMTLKAFREKYWYQDAFTVRHTDKEGKVFYAVVYREDISLRRMRFTLAHELGHVVMGHQGELRADEPEADHFAACFLAPRAVMRDLPLDLVLSRRCNISGAAATRCRCRRWEKVNNLFLVHMNRWYDWELAYSQLRDIYRKEYYHRQTRRTSPEEPPRKQPWPPELPDLAYTVPVEEVRRLWRWGRAFNDEAPPLHICPMADQCPHKADCAQRLNRPMAGVLAEGQTTVDTLRALLKDAVLREQACMLLRRKPPLPIKSWYAEGAKDFVYMEGKRVIRKRRKTPLPVLTKPVRRKNLEKK